MDGEGAGRESYRHRDRVSRRGEPPVYVGRGLTRLRGTLSGAAAPVPGDRRARR